MITVEEGSFRAGDGTRLVFELAAPSGSTATVLVLHGFGEHLRRYAHVVAALGEAGLATFAYDMRGQGRSGGRHGHVDRFANYLGDLDAASALARTVVPGAPLLALAHSHGGLVLTRRLVDDPAYVDGAVLSAPFLGLKLAAPAVKVLAARLASRIAPRIALRTEITPDMLSHDPAVQAAAASDPHCHQVGTPRWFTEARRAQAEVLARAAAITTPLLLILPDGDRIADGAVAERFCAATSSTDRTVLHYPGFEHESFNELGRERPIGDAVSWLRERAPATAE